MPFIYKLINPSHYAPLTPPLVPLLDQLDPNRVTYKNEIHRDSRYAICHYKLSHQSRSPADPTGNYQVIYDDEKSNITSNQKKTDTHPDILNCDAIVSIITQFLVDIGDPNLTRVEVKLIQTRQFPFEFNPHRDSQFRRLRHIHYLATLLVSVADIDGGQMQLFRSDNDKLGPFHLIETLPASVGSGYIVDETRREIFHGMTAATPTGPDAHRGALLLRFFSHATTSIQARSLAQ